MREETCSTKALHQNLNRLTNFGSFPCRPTYAHIATGIAYNFSCHLNHRGQKDTHLTAIHLNGNFRIAASRPEMDDEELSKMCGIFLQVMRGSGGSMYVLQNKYKMSLKFYVKNKSR